MGRRKQKLIARIVQRCKHITRLIDEQHLIAFRNRLAEYSARRLSQWAKQLDRLFDEWDSRKEAADTFIKNGQNIYHRVVRT